MPKLNTSVTKASDGFAYTSEGDDVFEVSFPRVPKLKLYFRKGEGNPRRNPGRQFDIVGAFIDGNYFVTYGSCNSAATIDAMVDLEDGVRDALLERIEKAEAELSEARRELAALS